MTISLIEDKNLAYMDSVRSLLECYGIHYPVAGRAQADFMNQNLQEHDDNFIMQ